MAPSDPAYLTVEHVQDGVIFTNLAPGRFEVSAPLLRWLLDLSACGGLWPYRVEVGRYNRGRDSYLLCVEEIPDASAEPR